MVIESKSEEEKEYFSFFRQMQLRYFPAFVFPRKCHWICTRMWGTHSHRRDAHALASTRFPVARLSDALVSRSGACWALSPGTSGDPGAGKSTHSSRFFTDEVKRKRRIHRYGKHYALQSLQRGGFIA